MIEFIDNLFQFFMSLFCCVLSGVMYWRNQSQAAVLSSDVLLWLFCFGRTVLDAFSAAVRADPQDLLCGGNSVAFQL